MKTSKEPIPVLLERYYKSCIEYFSKVNDSTYKAVVEAEHKCREANISSGEINRIRFNAFNAVEQKNGQSA